MCFAFFRSLLGDGNCGWRGNFARSHFVERLLSLYHGLAIAFGYFETLIQFALPEDFAREHLRLQGLDSLVGEELAAFWEDFRDPTLDLLRRVASSKTYRQRSDTILQAFNDSGTAGSIIQWFRVRGPVLY